MEKTLEHGHEIREEQIILPLTQILDNVTPKPIERQSLARTPPLRDSLRSLFPEQEHDEKDIKEAKEILGELAKEFSDTELKDLVAQIEYLAESWLDDFEREQFGGLTLRELLHERSAL